MKSNRYCGVATSFPPLFGVAVVEHYSTTEYHENTTHRFVRRAIRPLAVVKWCPEWRTTFVLSQNSARAAMRLPVILGNFMWAVCLDGCVHNATAVRPEQTLVEKETGNYQSKDTTPVKLDLGLMTGLCL